MTLRWAVALIASAACLACFEEAAQPQILKRAPKQTDDPNALIGPDVPDRRTPKASDNAKGASLSADIPGRASPEQPTTRWLITPRAIGTLTLGMKLGEPARGFEGTYSATYYADAQPLEGFALDEPPVLAVVAGGPFAKWGESHPGEPPTALVKATAVKQARAGKLTVDMLVTTDPRPKTELGIGVGDDFLAFSKRYPSAPAPSTFPALWEEPSCVIQQGTLWFFFDRCDTRAQATIIRIVVRKEERKVEKPKSKPKKAEPDSEY